MTQGPIALIMNQYTYCVKGSTVHSVRQLSHFGLEIDGQPSAIPDYKQCMDIPDQLFIPFNIINRLTRMPKHPSTEEDIDELLHDTVTSDDI